MRYHNITKDDMLNGDGLRVVLWVAGCEHHCKGCQNPITWDLTGGLLFTSNEVYEIEEQLKKDYISGITFSGGDPLHPQNRECILKFAEYIKKKFPNKTIWLYTGYDWEDINHIRGIENIDVIVDGKFVQSLVDINFQWTCSTNQRVIDVKKSLTIGAPIRYKTVIHEEK